MIFKCDFLRARSIFRRAKATILREISLTNELFVQKLYKRALWSLFFYALSQAVSVKTITAHALIV